MSITAAQLDIVVKAPIDQAENNLGRISDKLQESRGHALGFLGTLAGFAAGGVIVAGLHGAFDLVTGSVSHFLDVNKESAAVAANQASVLESTHGVAGMTAASLDKLTTSLLGTTGASDETIGSAENLLLTFTNIHSNVFPEATKQALNLATSLNHGVAPNMDQVQATAIQLGKALNDPVKGITALQRVGVSFTEQQKEQIKQMVAANNVAGAQRVILGELNTEFGKATSGYAATLPGQISILRAKFDNLQESTGQLLSNGLLKLMPVIQKLADWAGVFVPEALARMGALAEHVAQIARDVMGPSFTRLHESIKLVHDRLQPLLTALEQLGGKLTNAHGNMVPLQAVFRALSVVVDVIAMKLGQFAVGLSQGVGPMAGLHATAQHLWTLFEQLWPTIEKLGKQVLDLLPSLLQASSLFNPFSLIIHALLPAVQQLLPVLAGLAQQFITGLLPVVLKLVPILAQLAQQLIGSLATAFLAIAKALIPILPVIAQLALHILSALLPAVLKLAPVLVTLATHLIGALVPAFLAILRAVLPLLPVLANLVTTVITELVPVVLQLVTSLLAALMPAFTALLPIIVQTITIVAGLVAAILPVLIPVIQLLAGILRNIVVPVLVLVIGWFAQIITWVLRFDGAILGLIPSIARWVGDALGHIGQFKDNVIAFFEQLPGKIFDSGKAMIQGFIDGIKSLAGNVGQALGDVIHGAVNALPGGAQLAHLAGIPGFASGTEDAPGGVALVGEQGPELVYLPRHAGVVPNSGLRSSGSGFNPREAVQHIHIHLDGREVAELVVPHFPAVVRAGTGLKRW